MSEYEELRKDLELVTIAVAGYTGAVNRHGEATDRQIEKLWDESATLRDELHAVANRLENLTRAVTTSPAEVAAAIVNDANRSTLREVSNGTCSCCGGTGKAHGLHAACSMCEGTGKRIA